MSLPPLARLLAVTTVMLAVVLVGAPPASAHPVLVQSYPLPGVVAERPPDAIRLSFSEPIALSGSLIKIRHLDGGRIDVSHLTSNAGAASVGLPLTGDLPGGVYQVDWSVIGTDGHRLAGRFRFGVANADGTLPPGVEKLSEAGGTFGVTSPASSGLVEVYLRWAGLMAAALLLGGGLLGRRADARAVEIPQVWAGRLAVGAWAIAMTTEIHRTMASADTGLGAGFDSGLLIGTQSGVLALVRVGALAVLGGVAVRKRHLGRFAAAGAVALATHALDGHTASDPEGLGFAWVESVAHVEAAGVWAGGLLAVVLWSWLGRVRLVPLLRAFVPMAAVAMFVLALTGVLIATRRVESWMFLRWTGYGQLVLAKSLLLLCVLILSAWVTWRGQRNHEGLRPTVRTPSVPDERSQSDPDRLLARVVHVEVAVAMALVVLASVLTGLVPGRGQPAFAQRGNLLTGAALATAAIPNALLHATLAPARPGMNTISVIPESVRESGPLEQPDELGVRLACECAKNNTLAQLRQTAPGVWSAVVDLPAEGAWFAYLHVDDQVTTAPIALPVDTDEGGPAPFVVRATADLSGRGAERCRAFVQGLAMGIGRINAGGGVERGRKVVLDVRDDGGDPQRSKRLANMGEPEVLAPCGSGSPGAIRAGGTALTLAADPATTRIETSDSVDSAPIFQIALDPSAEGFGIGLFLEQTMMTTSSRTPKRVAVVADGQSGDLRVAGLKAALAGTGITVERHPADAAETAASLRRIVDPSRYIASLLDGDPARVSAALRTIGADPRSMPTSLFMSAQLSTEQFMLAAGPLGRLGALRVTSEVVPDSADGQAYAHAVGTIYPGDRARLDGLRGYVTALTLTEAVRDGTETDQMVKRLRKPSRYTDALNVPWRDDAPGRGTQGFSIYAANFLPATLVPERIGGMAYSGLFFQKGTWSRVAPTVYGPPPGLRLDQN